MFLSCNYCTMWPLMVVTPFLKSHHPVKFSGHRFCEGGNIVFFICRVSSRNRKEATILSNLLASCFLEVDIWRFLFFTWPHVTLWSTGYLTLWLRALHQKKWIYNVFHLSHDHLTTESKYLVTLLVVVPHLNSSVFRFRWP